MQNKYIGNIRITHWRGFLVTAGGTDELAELLAATTTLTTLQLTNTHSNNAYNVMLQNSHRKSVK